MNPDPTRPQGTATTRSWSAECKDCRRERNSRSGQPVGFEYSAEWSDRMLERGGSRSDRCSRHRRAHRDAIRAIAVPYVDLAVLGQVADPSNPSGPLGGLGPLPRTHDEYEATVQLGSHQFGLDDTDILRLLDGLADKPDGSTKRVAVLEAGTGTGKSTFVPFRLMNPPPGAPVRLTDAGPIVVTEPRVAAATGVASFVGESLCFGHEPGCGRHIGPGFPVGFQTSGNKNWDDACRLLYVTDGTMINWIREGRLARIGTVIVDEAHERSENIDLILALLREQLPRHPRLRVIIASATLDKDLFVEYFGGGKQVHYQQEPAVKSFGYGIPLFPGTELGPTALTEGIDDGIGGRFSGFGDTVLDGTGQTIREHAEHLLTLRPDGPVDAQEWIDRPPPGAEDRMSTAVAQQALRLLDGTDAGDILCFLPKATMIEAAVGLIQDGLADRGRADAVYPLLASTDDRIKRKALGLSAAGQRKVVVSSNLAETSLTLSGVRYVIDSGLICQSEWDPVLARKDVPTKLHSRSGVRQRWGRVGRDAPGFVFPLYSQAHFLELMPRDTPAGSTRGNLEQFVIKLKSAGVDDLSKVVLPANFTHQNYTRDHHGMVSAMQFTAELERAKASLTASGAVDTEQDLTALGRELERTEGTAEQAVAVILADRLTCLHEVAVAQHLLNGTLTGPSGLLQFDPDWPAAWRLHAYSCHKALAVGCEDDFELCLRVFAAWQNARDRERWARTWWVSHSVLAAAEHSARKIVESLSPRMAKPADRPVDLRLLERARGVMSRAYAMLRFTPADEGATWVSTLGPGSTAVLGRHQLTRPEAPVVAFKRMRPVSVGDDTGTPPLVIAHLLRLADWAVDGAPDPFALLERASRRARPEAPPPELLALDRLREELPVGVTVDTSSGRPERVGDPPLYSGGTPDPESGEDDGGRSDSGYPGSTERPGGSPRGRNRAARGSHRRTEADTEANASLGTPVPFGDVPEEEAALSLVPLEEENEEDVGDVGDVEQNWEESREAISLGDEQAAEERPGAFPADIRVRWNDDTTRVPQEVAEPAPPSDRGSAAEPNDNCVIGRVVGYECHDGRIVLLLEPAHDPGSVRLDGPDEPFGTDLALRVGGWARDYRDEFRILWAQDGRRFYIHPKARGLGARDVALARSLFQGTEAQWTVVPGLRGKDPADLSPLPWLRRQVEQARNRLPDGWLPARLEQADTPSSHTAEVAGTARSVAGPGPVVRLTLPGLDEGLSALTVHPRLIRDVEPQEDGSVEVRLGPDGSAVLEWPTSPDHLARLLSTHGAFLRHDGTRALRPVVHPLPWGTVQALLKAHRGADWQRRVWRFWLEGQRLKVLAVRVAGSAETVRLPDLLHRTWPAGALKAWGRQHGLERLVSDGSGHVTLFGAPTAVAAARADLADADAWSCVRITVAQAVIGRVRGKQSMRLDELREMSDVVACDMQEADLTLVARRPAAVTAVVARVGRTAQQAEGVLSLSSTRIGLFIGRKGSTRERLLSTSGCTSARQRGSGPLFDVTAPHAAHLDDLLRLIRLEVDAQAALGPVSVHAMQVTDLGTGLPWQSPDAAPAPTPAPPPAPAPAPATLQPSSPAAAWPPMLPNPVETEGATVEAAVETALRLLGLRMHQVEVQVLQEPQYTLFRRALKRPARVRVSPLPRDGFRTPAVGP